MPTTNLPDGLSRPVWCALTLTHTPRQTNATSRRFIAPAGEDLHAVTSPPGALTSSVVALGRRFEVGPRPSPRPAESVGTDA